MASVQVGVGRSSGSAAAPRATLFPMFLKLAGRKCLVVGGGRTAESKVESLLCCGATVHVVAPRITDTIGTWMREQRLTWRARSFASSDLQGMFLVVAATSSREVNEKVFRQAEARRILCNAVDEPDRCHFYYSAVVRRGDLQIAISTAGLSPALAKSLRLELESQIGPEYAAWLERLGEARRMLFARETDPIRRRRILHRLAGRRPEPARGGEEPA